VAIFVFVNDLDPLLRFDPFIMTQFDRCYYPFQWVSYEHVLKYRLIGSSPEASGHLIIGLSIHRFIDSSIHYKLSTKNIALEFKI